MNDQASQLIVAKCFKEGVGTTKSPDQAFYWFKSAAKHVDACASSRFELAKCYLYGYGTPPIVDLGQALYDETLILYPDEEIALYEYALWWKDIDSKRAFTLAHECLKKKGETQIKAKAKAQSACLLACITVDAKEKLQYYRIAADLGLAKGQYCLAEMLEAQGDVEEATALYQRSAAQGYPLSIYWCTMLRQ
jgi:TPR repeat protein